MTSAATRRFGRLVSVPVLLLLLGASPGWAAEKRADHYFGVNEDLDTAAVEKLRSALKAAECECKEIDQPCDLVTGVLGEIFQGTFRAKLPDVVVYIEKMPDGSVEARRPVVMWKGKNTPYIFGARHLYVLLVSDEKLPLEAKLTTIVETSTNPLAAFQKLVNLIPAEPAVKEPKSSTAQVAWTRLSRFEGPPFLGWARLDIEIDSVNRLTIHPRPETVTRTVTEDSKGKKTTEIETVAQGPHPLPGEGAEIPFREVTAHLSNSRSTFAGFGVALGATLDVEDTALGEDGGDTHTNAYAFAKLYAIRPRLKVGPNHHKRFRTSYGVVVGTNVGGDPFDELIVGLSVGNLIGKLGFTAGVNFVKPKTASDDMMDGASDGRSNEHKLFLGVDYAF